MKQKDLIDKDYDADQVEAIFQQAKAEFPYLLRMRAEQILKWGEDDAKSLYFLLVVLGEEFGETCKAVLQGVSNPLRAHHVRKEALQTAAVGVAIAEQMTKFINNARGKHGGN